MDGSHMVACEINAETRTLLQRVAAYYDLDYREVKCVATGLTALGEEAAARLSRMELTAGNASAEVPAGETQHAEEHAAEVQEAARQPLGAEALDAAIESAARSLLSEDPEALRRHEIMEEVAARRAQQAGTTGLSLREMSDAIFGHFDANGDGFLCLDELNALGTATGGNPLTELAYRAVCAEAEADSSCGISRDALWLLYSDAGMGDPKRDFNMIFRSNGVGTVAAKGTKKKNRRGKARTGA